MEALFGPLIVPVSAETWIRRTVRCRLMGAWFAASLVAYLALVGLSSSQEPTGTGVDWAFTIVSAVVVGIAAVRWPRAGLWMSSEEVIVRGVLWTRRFATGDITEFAPGVVRMGGTTCVKVESLTGARFGVMALGKDGLLGWPFNRYKEELRPMCDSLNELLAELQSVRSAP